jgi:hypothetical protein
MDFRKTMRAQIPVARQVLQKMLRDRLAFTPEKRGKQRGYRFNGEGSVMPLLTGMIPELSQAVASPSGCEEGRQWQPATFVVGIAA